MNEHRRVLPYGRQCLDQSDMRAVLDVLESNALTTGPMVEEFERALAQRLGGASVAVVSSGTAALHLAAMAAGLQAGDTVVVPAITFVAAANVSRLLGADVIFADVNADTGLMGPDDLEAAIQRAGKPVRLAFPTHLNGQVANMPALAEVAARHGTILIEDACHALGAQMQSSGEEWTPVGASRHSAMTVFSFHPVKTIAMGEGGAISTADPLLAKRLKQLRSHGITRDTQEFTTPEALNADGRAHPWFYEVVEPALNYRASDIHCALGVSQLTKLDQFLAARNKLMDRYRTRVSTYAPILRTLAPADACRPGWHLAVALIDFSAAGVERDEVMRSLQEAGIGTQVHYIPLYIHPAYRHGHGHQKLAGAEAYYSRALSLPLFVGMCEDDVDYVVASLAKALRLE